MIRAVLFDLDGTLLNRDESVKRFINNQYERMKSLFVHISKEEYVKRFIELDNRGYVWKDQVYQQLVDEFEIIKITWEELLQDYIKEFKHHCVPFPNLIEMLDEFRNRKITLGMITNGKGQFQKDNIIALGIEEYFEVILVSEWEGLKKPDPRIFKLALERLNVLPHESVFVGDHPENDVKGAQHLGMIGIWKKDFQWSNVDADYIVDDLAELPQVIDALNSRTRI